MDNGIHSQRRRLAALALSLTIAIAAESMATEADSHAIYGTWDLFEVKGNGMTARVRLTVGEHSVTNTTSCSSAGKHVLVEARAPARITDGTIEVLESREAREEYASGFLNCTVTLEKGTIHYAIDRGHLVIQAPRDGQRMELTRSGSLFRGARPLAGIP